MKYAIVGKRDFRGRQEDYQRVVDSNEKLHHIIWELNQFEVYILTPSNFTEAEWRGMTTQYFLNKQREEDLKAYNDLKEKLGL